MLVKKTFELAPKHFVDGLSSDDFSNYVGAYIPVFSLSDFPHWAKLSRTRSLTPSEISERAQAIESAAKESFSSSPAVKTYTISTDDSEWLAEQTSACFSCPNTVPIAPTWTPSRGHYSNLQASGLSHLQQLDIYDCFNERKNVVYPEPIENETQPIAQLPRLVIPDSSVVLLEPIQTDERLGWARLTCLNPDYVLRFPKGNWSPIDAGLHEMRHLVQLHALGTTGSRYSFYGELDADLFARDVIQRTNAGSGFLLAGLHARYLHTLFDTSEYWYAPIIEAIEHKQPLPQFKEISNAVHAFHCAMICCLHDDQTRPQDIISASPRDGLNLIRSAQKFAAVQNNKLACHIVDRVQAALTYFCPQIQRPCFSGQPTTGDRAQGSPQP